MKFVYQYRTSDGERLEGRIEAANRDAAFAALRQQGIRPMKMFDDPEVQRGRIRAARIVCVVLVLSVCGAIIGRFLWEKHAEEVRYQAGTRETYRRLSEKAQAVRDQYAASVKLLDLTRMKDYETIRRSPDVSGLLQELRRARDVVDSTRKQAKQLFADIYRIFPSGCVNERVDAQRMYGELMTFVDSEEAQIENTECMLMLLDANRSKWSVKNGQLVFSDRKLEQEFSFFETDPDPATSRWHRDFGSVIESNVIELPLQRKQKR